MSVVVRRLEVEGFKSFRDRTALRLPDSVSVLVGSNGSGKSNITDALRWAFGERDLMSLRVRTPAELHFLSHDGGDATSSARVTVALESAGRPAVETGGREGVAGLTFTRSLERDGRETLWIDGTLVEPGELDVRLREMGVRAPLRTVVRQGEVGRLLWLEPGERTELFASLWSGPDGRHGHAWPGETIERCARLGARIAHHRQREADLREELGRSAEGAVRAADAARLDAEIESARDRLLVGLAREVGVEAATPDDVTEPAPDGAGRTVAELRGLLDRRRALGQVDMGALARLDELEKESARVTAARRAASDELAREREGLRRTADARHTAFVDLHDRVERRFESYFQTLVPGGEASLPLSDLGPDGGQAAERDRAWPGDLDLGLPGVGVRVRFPKKTELPLQGLSGGQLVVVGLCLALAYFAEIPSPILVLDEVEPALDEIMVRRVTRLLAMLAEERQVLVVSHQRMTRETARTVFQVDRTPALGSHIKLHYDPREFRAPGHR